MSEKIDVENMSDDELKKELKRIYDKLGLKGLISCLEPSGEIELKKRNAAGEVVEEQTVDL